MPLQKKTNLIRIVLLLVIIAVLVVLGIRYPITDYLSRLLSWIEGLGSLASLVFIGLYILATVLFIPGSIITLAAGALFGVIQGSILVSIGSITGATIAFFIGRYFARDAVANAVAKNEKCAAIDRAISKEGWKIVGLLRLSPIVPFNFSNYFYGITGVKPLGYILASWVGMLPGTIMYVYIGSIIGFTATADRQRTTGEWVLYGAGLAATILVTVFITRIAMKAVRQKVT